VLTGNPLLPPPHVKYNAHTHSLFQDFLDRSLLPARKLLTQGFHLVKLKFVSDQQQMIIHVLFQFNEVYGFRVFFPPFFHMVLC
jgi:hypothetical protein